MTDRAPLRTAWRRPVGAIAALVIVLSGCSGGDGAAATTTLPPLVTTTAPVQTTTSTSTTTTSTTTTSTTTTLPPTTTTAPIVTAGGIVMVANASGVPGAAARLTDALAGEGFATVPPVNAAGSDESLIVTVIYSRDITDPVATSVARLMGDVPVIRMPTPLPVESGLPGDATVVVMLATDRADVELVQL